MTTCLGKSFSFVLLCVSFVNVYQFSCVSFFPFRFEGGMWDVIVSIPDHCRSIYFVPEKTKAEKEFPIYHCKGSRQMTEVSEKEEICPNFSSECPATHSRDHS